MSADHICQARAQSDQMRCAPCGLVWDANDTSPPECPRDEERYKANAKARAADPRQTKLKFW